jgi:hypothetical protein
MMIGRGKFKHSREKAAPLSLPITNPTWINMVKNFGLCSEKLKTPRHGLKGLDKNTLQKGKVVAVLN